MELQIVVNDYFIITMAMAYRAVRGAGTNFVPSAVPAHLENTTSTPVAVHQGSSLKRRYKQINNQLHRDLTITMNLLRCCLDGINQTLTVVFQMWTHLSKEPLARCLPSGLKATL